MSLKKLQKLIEKVPRQYLVIANQTIFVMLVIFLIYPYFINENKKIYTGNEWVIQESAKNLAKQCVYGKREECYKSGFETLIKKYNFSFAEKTLYALQDIDEGTKSCHVLAHYLSRTAVKKNPTDWKYLLDNVNVNTCGSGFLHGVLEAHLGDNPETKFSGELSNEVCNRGEDSYRKRMCTHFMGHFFVVNTFDRVDEAIPACDSVVLELKFDCLDGVFMEHHQKIALEDHGILPFPEYTPLYAQGLAKNCLKYSGQQSSACWTEMAEVFAKTYGYDAKTLYSKCYNTGASPKDGERCYNKGIVLQATYPYNVTTEKLVAICAFYKNNDDYQRCIGSLISSLLYYTPKYTTRGINLCSHINQDRRWCFQELGKQLKKFVPNVREREMLCAPALDLYQRDLCINKE